MTTHTLGTVTRDADGDLIALCTCGQHDCAQPWSLAAAEQVSAMNFRDWLIGQRRRNSPIGDLAGDVRRDPCARVADSPRSLYAHITMEHGACAGAWKALTRSIGEWLLYGYGQPYPQAPGAGGVQVGAPFGTRSHDRPRRAIVQTLHLVAPHLLPEHENGGAGR